MCAGCRGAVYGFEHPSFTDSPILFIASSHGAFVFQVSCFLVWGAVSTP